MSVADIRLNGTRFDSMEDNALSEALLSAIAVFAAAYKGIAIDGHSLDLSWPVNPTCSSTHIPLYTPSAPLPAVEYTLKVRGRVVHLLPNG